MTRYSTRTRPAVVAGSLAAAAAATHAAAQLATPIASPDATPIATPVAEAPSWMEIMEGMWQTIQTHYATDSGLYRPYYPAQHGDNPYCYLWPWGAVVSAVNMRAAALKTPEADAILREHLAAQEQYNHAPGQQEGYDSYVVSQGGGDRFYDDNMWLGIDAVYAGRHLQDEQYLQTARDIWAWLETGWTDELGGGFLWHAVERNTKNTCSNGPAAVMAMLLYEETGEQAWLDWAVTIMDWLDATLFDEESGVYHDHITLDGHVDTMKWSYNAGTPLHAKALLYRATGDERYRTEARALAAAAKQAFAPTAVTGPKISLFPNTPWFNVILHRGYVALQTVDPEVDPSYVRMLPELLRYAWGAARDPETGILAVDWTWPGQPGREEVLQQAPAVEVAASAIILGLA